ncbi:sodium:glutamate symporter [Alkalihalobacillus alcalophilus ATCC 27647 = CGMCC 1.3604]|uniref:Proton/sodium ion:dicarboxylate transporter n=1 Tax=Alkalihalobacillus alcalophilus ATCC 27647 = CGMCC 1.3604 TaxID=1218173 RepID=J8TBS2_ALKAL|nr:dicarboxylate/amino acid:cation symporter [Alkalihalobacillus alcalophilus]AFV25771.1 proton/sodium ion:dicarboxylate transporter [Alkalihalobacillus alcalophilus ATCC 27647 = CGMCC 1.3604]MED1562371.1 dicarboxylate/amino acid:cation symporter [Alkalihalobacillus alcalophilus]THG92002.1 sodium:glutamate symporter [Alkalihalobacillus alcalophilus ATCC 27647 = CGMCC 1.3604]
MKLILKLLAGIIIGILIGLFAPDFIIRLLITFKVLFGSFITFIIPFIILFFIASGVAGLGKSSGKLVGSTVSISFVSTILAGVLAFLVAVNVIPLLSATNQELVSGSALLPYLELEIAPLMGVMTALMMAFVFGIGVTKVKGQWLKNIFDEGKNIVELVIAKIIIPLLPFYIAGIFAEMGSEGTVFTTLQVFGVVLLMVIILHWVWLMIQYTIAGIMTKQNPFTILKKMLPAYFTALGTMSSVATIPVTLRSIKQTKVRESIANFGIPLGASIHLSGSMITITLCATAVMMMLPGLAIPSFIEMIPVIIMLGLVMVAAPGVPGGAVMAALGVLTSMLGFTEAAIGLMIALYMAQDSFGTAANVTGDGAVITLVDKFAKEDIGQEVEEVELNEVAATKE